jgi:hypothetical protein
MSEPVTRDFWSMRSDEAGTNPNNTLRELVNWTFRDLTDHKGTIVEVESLARVGQPESIGADVFETKSET